MPVLRIVSKRNGFRRCGMAHPDQPVVHPDGKFTDEQVEILKAEPMLIVDEIPDEELPESKDDVPAGKPPKKEKKDDK